jgi:hypothetical protein
MGMPFYSLTMDFVMCAMGEVSKGWARKKIAGEDLSEHINPSVPLIVRIDDYAFEVQSCGGDPGQEGMVLCCQPEPIGKWVENEQGEEVFQTRLK